MAGELVLAGVTFASVLVMSLTHIFAGRMRFLQVVPRSRWLSLAGGVSVAYVFLRILPELEAGGQVLSQRAPVIQFLERHHTYVVALVGLAVFYGLERLAQSSRRERRQEVGEDATSAGVFWVHIGSFAVYNALIGYLLVKGEERTILQHILFGIALTLHFLVNDIGLYDHHKAVYAHVGRWVLAGAVLAGWGMAWVLRVPEWLTVATLAFLAGGVIMNVLKEELPAERESRWWAFAAGAAAYAALLLSL